MEFFDWMGIPQVILSFWNFTVEGEVGAILSVQMRVLVITLWATLGLYLVGHLFGGIGLYKMAKRAEDKFAWMAFVPVLNTYLSGRLAGETVNVFGAKVKHFGIITAAIELVYIAINVFTLTISMLLMQPDWNVITETVVGDQVFYGTELNISAIPRAVQWMPTALNVMDIIGLVWYFITLFAFVMLYSAFFRKYYARSPFMMAFLCSLFPVRGYVLFAVRNNAPVDYDRWMQERVRRMQQQQYGYGQPPYGGTPYGNQPPYNGQPPYGNQPPYGGTPYGGSSYGGEDAPFSDVTGENGTHDDEPFSDL